MEVTPLELLAQRFPGVNQEELRSSLGRFGLSGDIVFQSIDTLSGGMYLYHTFNLVDTTLEVVIY
jgi:ATPase subunit of ABC transporter with duplicated ATPase domains